MKLQTHQGLNLNFSTNHITHWATSGVKPSLWGPHTLKLSLFRHTRNQEWRKNHAGSSREEKEGNTDELWNAVPLTTTWGWVQCLVKPHLASYCKGIKIELNTSDTKINHCRYIFMPPYNFINPCQCLQGVGIKLCLSLSSAPKNNSTERLSKGDYVDPLFIQFIKKKEKNYLRVDW